MDKHQPKIILNRMKTGYSHTSPNVERDEGTHQRWRYGPITLRREYAHYLNVHICKGEIVAASGTQVTCAQQYGLAKHGLATDVHTSLSWLIYLDLYFWDHCHEKVWDFWCFSVPYHNHLFLMDLLSIEVQLSLGLSLIRSLFLHPKWTLKIMF